jgi:hypothetical protein
LKICSVLFFDPYVELFMRGYIAVKVWVLSA